MAVTEYKEVAYCGLYCGDCIIREGNIGGLATKLLEVVEDAGFQKLADGLPVVKPEIIRGLRIHRSFKQTLIAMMNLNCGKICRDGDGSTDCKIRSCCQMNQFTGCWECGDFRDCRTLAWLDPVHEGAQVENIKRIRMIGMAEFIKGPISW